MRICSLLSLALISSLALGQEVVSPTLVDFSLGEAFSGDLTSLVANDGNLFVVRSAGFRDYGIPHLRMRVRAQTSILSPSRFIFRMKAGSMNVGWIRLHQIDLFNYVSNSYEPCTTGFLGWNLGTLSFEATGNLERFVRRADGAINARVNVLKNGPPSPYMFDFPNFGYDSINWEISP